VIRKIKNSREVIEILKSIPEKSSLFISAFLLEEIVKQNGNE